MQNVLLDRGSLILPFLPPPTLTAVQSRPSSMATPIDPDTVTTSPVFISATVLRSILSYKSLISHLQASLPAASLSLSTPPRHSHATTPTSSLLLMPSWSSSSSLPYIGVKLVTYNPQNSSLNLPGVHATYVLFSSHTGQTLALMDATELTLLRTASISALASSYLSNNDARVLIMVGAGYLAPHLIKAHLAVRPNLQRVIIWNRTPVKATALASDLRREKGFEGVVFDSCECLEEVIILGDIVSCATNSEAALVAGERLKEGAHLDLVGSFTKTMRECDDEAIRRGRLFVDHEGALEEAGELVGAFERGVISREDVCGNLVELIKGEKDGRKDSREITVFKSVGSGVVDILAAQLIYETYLKESYKKQI